MSIAAEITVPLPLATQRVASELGALKIRLQRLEDGLETVFDRAASVLDGQTIGMLQEVDVVLQSIEALALYLERISSATTVDGTVGVEQALRKVPLRDVARRLGGCQEVRDNSGHPELF